MDIGKIVRRIEVDPAESPEVPAGPIGEPAAAPRPEAPVPVEPKAPVRGR